MNLVQAMIQVISEGSQALIKAFNVNTSLAEETKRESLVIYLRKTRVQAQDSDEIL